MKPPDTSTPQPADTDPATEEPLAMLYCPACSLRLQERGCKLRCPRCGYYMSCSDYV